MLHRLPLELTNEAIRFAVIKTLVGFEANTENKKRLTEFNELNMLEIWRLGGWGDPPRMSMKPCILFMFAKTSKDFAI